MNRRRSALLSAVLLAIAALLYVNGRQARSAEELVDNPPYLRWHNFKPGSQVILIDSETSPVRKLQARVTQTLIEVTDNSVKVESVVEQTGVKPRKQLWKYAAKCNPMFAMDVPPPKTGEEDVKIGNETYHCIVYSATTASATTKPAVNRAHTESKWCICDKVPGGLVTRHVALVGELRSSSDWVMESCTVK